MGDNDSGGKIDWSRNFMPLVDFRNIRKSKIFRILEEEVGEGEFLIIDARGVHFKFNPEQGPSFEKHNVYVGKKDRPKKTPRYLGCVNRILRGQEKDGRTRKYEFNLV